MRLQQFSLSCILVVSSFSAACSVRTDRPRQFDGNDVNCSDANCDPDPGDDDSASGGRSGGGDTSRGGATDSHSTAGAPTASGPSAPAGTGGSVPTTPIFSGAPNFGAGGAQAQGAPTMGGAPGFGGSSNVNAPQGQGGAPSGSGGAPDAKGGAPTAMGGASTNATGGAASPAPPPQPITAEGSWYTSSEVVLVDGGNWHCAKTDNLLSIWSAQTCIYIVDGNYKPAVIVRNRSTSPVKMGAMVRETESGNKFSCKATSVPASTYVVCVGKSLPVPSGATELLAQGFLVEESGTETHVAYDYTMTFKP